MWFTEDAWSPIIACVLTAALCFAISIIGQKPKLLWGVVLLFVASVTIFFVEKVIITDTEQVESALTDLVDTFVAESQQNPKVAQPQCVRYFSARNDRDKARIAAALAFVVVESVRVADVHIQLTNQSTRAVTRFRANGTIRVGGNGGHYPTRWELTWQKEAGEWRVTQTRMLKVTTDDEIGIPQVDR